MVLVVINEEILEFSNVLINKIEKKSQTTENLKI